MRTQPEKTVARSVDGRSEQRSITSEDVAFYSNGTHDADFKVDTFEYRLLREAEFREAVTRHSQVRRAVTCTQVSDASTRSTDTFLLFSSDRY